MKNSIKTIVIILLLVINTALENNNLKAGTTALNLTCFQEGFYSPIINSLVRPITITVSLHYASSPYFQVSTAVATLDENGRDPITFLNIPIDGDYYIVVKSWNMLGTWSLPQHFTVNRTTVYNFYVNAGRALGGNMKQLDNSPEIWGMYSGELNSDGYIDGMDMALVYNSSYNFTEGSSAADLNGDMIVDGDDLVIVGNNARNFIHGISP